MCLSLKAPNISHASFQVGGGFDALQCVDMSPLIVPCVTIYFPPLFRSEKNPTFFPFLHPHGKIFSVGSRITSSAIAVATPPPTNSSRCSPSTFLGLLLSREKQSWTRWSNIARQKNPQNSHNQGRKTTYMGRCLHFGVWWSQRVVLQVSAEHIVLLLDLCLRPDHRLLMQWVHSLTFEMLWSNTKYSNGPQSSDVETETLPKLYMVQT